MFVRVPAFRPRPRPSPPATIPALCRSGVSRRSPLWRVSCSPRRRRRPPRHPGTSSSSPSTPCGPTPRVRRQPSKRSPDARARPPGGAGAGVHQRPRAQRGDPALARQHPDRPLSLPARGARQHRLPPGRRRFPTLATVLHGAGYATGAFVGAFPLDSQFGLDRGFDVYDDRYPEGSNADGVRPPRAARATRWCAWPSPGGRRGRGKPRFLWIHLYDPHAPYEPPEPFAVAVQGQSLPRRGGRHGLVPRAAPRAVPRRQGEAGPGGGHRDHGESLGEHGEQTHGLFAYEATLKVPLVVWGRGRGAGAGRRGRRGTWTSSPPCSQAAGVTARRREPRRPGARCSARRARGGLLLRVAVGHAEPRLGAAARPAARRHEVHRPAAARGLRPAEGPGREGQPVRRGADGGARRLRRPAQGVGLAAARGGP